MVVSVLFKKNDAKPNPFFNWLDDPAQGIDISQLIPVDYFMTHDLFGYLGTTTQPPCKPGIGWYILPTFFEMSSA